MSLLLIFPTFFLSKFVITLLPFVKIVHLMMPLSMLVLQTVTVSLSLELIVLVPSLQEVAPTVLETVLGKAQTVLET